MARYADLDLPDDPKLARNIARFARALRKAGLTIGPGRVIDAVRAVEATGFTARADFYHTSRACFVSKPDQRAVFDQVFRDGLGHRRAARPARDHPAGMRSGGEVTGFATRTRRIRWPSLVALCDISGSMSHYSRAVLHFLHAVSNEKGAGWAEVHAFTFGTRLTNITRHLRQREVDPALAAAGAEAQDWEGGTRIGECLTHLNRDWSRRVTGRGGRASDHRRARPGRCGGTGPRDRAAEAVGAATDLAEPASEVRRIRAARAWRRRDDAACRLVPRRARHRLARWAGRGDRPARRDRREGQDAVHAVMERVRPAQS